jgi:hypothetical protein
MNNQYHAPHFDATVDPKRGKPRHAWRGQERPMPTVSCVFGFLFFVPVIN